MKVKCLLVDDEPLAIRLLQNHIQQLANLEVVASCSNAIKALEILRSTRVDLMFLDIKMPGITGIDFLKGLKNPPAVIITTAYREYAIEGYELDLVDYLLKPITFERFFNAIDRYLRQKGSAVLSQAPADMDQGPLFIKSGNKIYKVPPDDIYYIESLRDDIIVHCRDKTITTKYKISDIEEELSGRSFVRIHRSFIININKVTAFSPNAIEIEAKEIPIGSSYKEYVSKILLGTMKGLS